MKFLIKPTLLSFFSMLVFAAAVWVFLKYNKPDCVLPNVDYIGMSKDAVLKIIHADAPRDPLSQKVLLHIPFGRTIDVHVQIASKETMEYLYKSPIWDVNYMHVRGRIKGGYYFYRLYFNESGKAGKQVKMFQSDIGLFGL